MCGYKEFYFFIHSLFFSYHGFNTLAFDGPLTHPRGASVDRQVPVYTNDATVYKQCCCACVFLEARLSKTDLDGTKDYYKFLTPLVFLLGAQTSSFLGCVQIRG